jgi:hypothetical protein
MARLDHKDGQWFIAHLSRSEATDLVCRLVEQLAGSGNAAPSVAVYDRGVPCLRVTFSVEPSK